MGISQDQGKLEELQKFADFFNFLSNPQEYKTLLADAKATLAGMTATITAHTAVKDALAFRAACEAKVAETNEFVRGELERIAKAEKAAKEAEAVELERIAEIEQRAAAKAADADKMLELALKSENKAAEREAAVMQNEKSLAEREASLREQLLLLESKRTQLAALLK